MPLLLLTGGKEKPKTPAEQPHYICVENDTGVKSDCTKYQPSCILPYELTEIDGQLMCKIR